MEQRNIGNWFGALGNVGIVVGLVLVYGQMQQVEELTRLDLTARGREQDMMFQLHMMGEDPAAAWAKAGRTPDALTPAEARQVDSLLEYRIAYWRYHAWLIENGMQAPSEAWVEHGDLILAAEGQFLFGANAVARRWWNGRADEETEWMVQIDRGVQQAAGTETDDQHRYLIGEGEPSSR